MKLSQKTTLLFVIVTFSLIIQVTFVHADDSIQKDYSLPNQSWKFIQITNLNRSQLTDYIWTSSEIVQGIQVTEQQYSELLALGLTERSAYFDTLEYFEGTSDSGRTTTTESGYLWFVFFNPQTEDANLGITLTYRSNSLQPWAVGLITTVAVIVVLLIGVFVAAKLRKKMIQEALEEEEKKKSPAQRYLEM